MLTSPITIRVQSKAVAEAKIAEFIGEATDYTLNVYEHKGSMVHDVICDEIVELRIIVREN